MQRHCILQDAPVLSAYPHSPPPQWELKLTNGQIRGTKKVLGCKQCCVTQRLKKYLHTGACPLATTGNLLWLMWQSPSSSNSIQGKGAILDYLVYLFHFAAWQTHYHILWSKQHTFITSVFQGVRISGTSMDRPTDLLTDFEPECQLGSFPFWSSRPLANVHGYYRKLFLL